MKSHVVRPAQARDERSMFNELNVQPGVSVLGTNSGQIGPKLDELCGKLKFKVSFLNWVRLAQNLTNLGPFKISFQNILARAKMF